MNIEIGKVEKFEFYIDKAFNRGKKRVSLKIKLKKTKSIEKVEKQKYLESIRMSVIKDSICDDLGFILKSFPHYVDLDYFYKQLFACFIDVDNYKKSLAAVKWAQKRISSIFRTQDKIMRSKTTAPDVTKMRNVFLARCSSILKQINDAFGFLDMARKQIKELPNIKTSTYTVAIAGFPNVGKSTLLGKLTDSKPEVNSYAFTTRGLMIGYIKDKEIEGGKIQVIDTPGTLNRFEKMNNIEKMAHLSLKHLAGIIVYVFDLTEPYPLAEQLKLFEDLKKLDKPVIVYFSKSDIMDTKLIDDFKIKGTYDANELKKIIIKNS